jgi:large repetitive protein
MSMNRQRKTLELLRLAVVVLCAAQPVAAAVFEVDPKRDECRDETGDETGRPFCTLQAALRAAEAAPGADTIELVGGGTYTFAAVDNFDSWETGANALPRIRGEVVIRGHGATLVRDRAPDTPRFRFFLVDPEGRLELHDLTLRGASTEGLKGERDGGAIWNRGTLRLVRTTLVGNIAGGDGGGLRNDGEAELENSLFEDNAASAWGAAGGAIFNTEDRGPGRMNIRGCALVANRASTQAGGVWNEAEMVIADSTLSANVAEEEGGGLRNNGRLTLVHVTVTGNRARRQGGGVHNLGTLDLGNSLIAGNDSPAGADCWGRIELAGPNLIGQLTSCTTSGEGTVITGQELRLAPLQRQAGHIPVHPIGAGSSAINAGSATRCTPVDQRGVLRPPGACDLGAYERLESVSVAAGGQEGCDDTLPPTFCTLAAALEWVAPGGTVTLSAGTHTARVHLTHDVTLVGKGRDQTIVDGGGAGRVLQIAAEAKVVARDLTIRGGDSRREDERDGGGVWNLGELTLERCAVVDNRTGDDGGGISNNGTLTVRWCKINGNRGDHWGSGGGGIYSEAVRGPGIVTLEASEIRDNVVGDDGGGIWTNGELRMIDTTVSGNTARTFGGGIHNSGELVIENSRITDNRAAQGGGLCNSSGKVRLSASELTANQAPKGPDCLGTLDSAGENRLGDPAGCVLQPAGAATAGGKD